MTAGKRTAFQAMFFLVLLAKTDELPEWLGSTSGRAENGAAQHDNSFRDASGRKAASILRLSSCRSMSGTTYFRSSILRHRTHVRDHSSQESR
jgi:hypothetical protein